MTTTYPIGMGTQEVPLTRLRELFEPRMHPGYARRLFPWIESKGGLIGIQSGWRPPTTQSGPNDQAGNRSFHRTQDFADGTSGYCAVDLCVRRSGGLGHSAGHVPSSEVPNQGTTYAKEWGLHCNVGTPGKTGYEPWHIQPIEIDGWWNWHAGGRPSPRMDYPLPKPAVSFDPANGVWGLYPLNPNKQRCASREFVESRLAVSDNRWTWSGDLVRYLQGVILLKAGGNITVDGWFGAQTDLRVKDLQGWFGYTVDGLVGPSTWKLIDALSAS